MSCIESTLCIFTYYSCKLDRFNNKNKCPNTSKRVYKCISKLTWALHHITPTTPLPNLECHSKVLNHAPKGVIFIHLWCSKYSHHFTIVIYDCNMFIVEATVQKLTNLSSEMATRVKMLTLTLRICRRR